jgi:type I restriction enzyme, S subunit
MSFPRYPQYKDSGVEWLGEVPGHWETMPLSRTASESESLFIDGDWIESKDLSDDGIRYLTSGNVGNGYYKEQGQGYISEETFTALNCVEVIPGDVLISRLNLPIGRSCVVPDLGGRIVTCVDNVIVRSDPEFDRRFFVYQLTSKSHFSNMENLARGTTMQRISRSILGRVRFVFPSFAEQNQIADFLDRETAKIDALVAQQRRLMALLKEKRQAVISHAVTQGLNPQAPMKPSGIEWLGEVPAHWDVTKIKRLVATFEQGWSPQCEGFPVDSDKEWGVLKVGCVNGGAFRPEENKTLPPELEPIPSLGIAMGDLLISRANTRELVGSAAVAKQDYAKLMLCDKLYRIRFSKAACAPQFIAFYLGTGMARGQIELAASGASSSMVNISQSTILEMELALPESQEQQEIVDFLAIELIKFDTLTTEAQRAIDLLQERRTALISAAVTGQIDVRKAI